MHRSRAFGLVSKPIQKMLRNATHAGALCKPSPRLQSPGGRLLAFLALTVLLSACARSPSAPAPATQPPAAPTAAPAITPTADTSVRISSVVANAAAVSRYEKLELTIDLNAAFQNPFDPAQIDVQATFSGPDGKAITVPGFYWQDFDSALANGKEVLTPRGQPAWKVRFTPTQEGAWSYSVSVKTPGGSAMSAPANTDVTPAQRHGFVRIDKRDPAYFAFDDGTPYFAIGQNVGWYGDGGTHDYERWFGKMHAQGANFARVWMASWATAIEWNDTGLGDYTKRLDRAWQLDRVFDLAAQNDIYILLMLLNHGAFNTGVNPEWDQNPYNAANGGPCKTPEDFATNAQARDLFKRRLRYIAARWGYSPNLLAWEWWNEVDWTPLRSAEIQMPWIKEMTAFLAPLDPYQHLRTTSYANGGDDVVFAMPEIDISQRHSYNPDDPAQTFPRGMAEMLPAKKPALYGEVGTGANGADATQDPQGVHIHNALWAGVMTKGSGTGMSWWWDNYIDPLDLYPLFGGPAAFLKGEDLAAAGYRPRRPRVEGAPVTMLLLAAPDRMLGWVRSNEFSYNALRKAYSRELLKAMQEKRKPSALQPTFPLIAGATWQLNGLPPGSYTVEWWDTSGATILSTDTLIITGESTMLKLPAFERDLAFKIRPA